MMRNKSFGRFVSVLLSFILLFNMIPMPTYAAGDSSETSAAEYAGTDGTLMESSESVTLPPVEEVPGEEPASPVPTFDHLYADESLLEGLDFSSMRLIVRTGDPSILTWDTVVVKEDNGVYWLQFDSEFAAKSAYTYYYGIADSVEVDTDRATEATPSDLTPGKDEEESPKATEPAGENQEPSSPAQGEGNQETTPDEDNKATDHGTSDEDNSEEEPGTPEQGEPDEETEEDETAEEDEKEEPVQYIFAENAVAIADESGDDENPVSKDNVIIHKVSVRWLTASDGSDTPAAKETLELSPQGELVKNQQFQIDFSVSGQSVFEPGEIQIEIPAHLWQDRDGNFYGDLSLSVPQAPDANAEFVWEATADGKIIIRNNKQLSSSSKVLIQGSFRNMEAWRMKDGTHSLDEGFYADLTVTTPAGNQLSKKSNVLDAVIHTDVHIAAANKTAYDAVKKSYSIWWDEVPSLPDELMANLPDGANPDDYVYVRWYVDATATGNQPYEMAFEDTLDAGDKTNYGGVMLGATDTWNGAVAAEGDTVKATYYEGHDMTVKTAYVWTAYSRDKLKQWEDAGNQIIFHNEQTASVQGDDQDTPTYQQAEADVRTKMPTEYTFVKVWEDDENALGFRPSILELLIYDDSYSMTKPWRRIWLTRDEHGTKEEANDNWNNWTYTWSDEGNPDSRYRVEEILYNAAGVFDMTFNDELLAQQWRYFLSNIARDDTTHTWTYTNTLTMGEGHEPISNIEKKVSDFYTDDQLISNQDNDLTLLLYRSTPAEVLFTVRTTLAAATLSKEGGVAPNRFALEDTRYTLNNQQLPVDDIDISAVTVRNVTVWEYLDDPEVDENGLRRYRRGVVEPRPDVELYGLIDGDWQLMATMDSNNVVTPKYDGVTVTQGLRINLPKGVAQVRMQVECDAQIVDISYDVFVRIWPTDTIKGMISDALAVQDYIRFDLANRADASVTYVGKEDQTFGGKTYHPGERLVELLDSDTGYLHGKDYKVAADLAKSFTMVESDPSLRRIKLHTTLTLTQQSNITFQAEYLAAIEDGFIPNTTSGTYYDLLPYGVEPDLTSIRLSGGDTLVRAWTIENYQESGRTLLIVQVNETNNVTYDRRPDKAQQYVGAYPDSGYKNVHTLDFDAYVSWDISQALDIVEYMHNVAAYSANEDEIGNYKGWEGEPNDPSDRNNETTGSSFRGNEEGLMTNLPGAKATNSVVYAGAPVTGEQPDYTARFSLYKEVLVPSQGIWSTGQDNSVNVEEDGSYVYRIKMTSDSETKTRELVFFDILEVYKPHDVDLDADDTYTWRGRLVSVDVSQMASVGANPKVYYTVQQGVSIRDYGADGYGDALDKGLDGWTTERPADMSKVTGIAIDVRTDKSGNPFILGEGESLIAHLYMRAPYDEMPENELPYYLKDDGTNYLVNAHAYNEVFMGSRTEKDNTVSLPALLPYSYTKVGIYTRHFDIYKVWEDGDDADGKRPGSLTVTLTANGEETNRSVTISDQPDEEGRTWYGRINRLKTYDENDQRIEYSVIETSNELDQHPDFDKDYTLTIVRKDFSDHAEIHMINTHEPEKISLPVSKVWDDMGNAHPENTHPAMVEVELFADGQSTGKRLFLTEDNGWQGEFTDLIKNHDGGIPYEYTVVEKFVDDYQSTWEQVTETVTEEIDGEEVTREITKWVVTNKYYPYGDLIVRKHLESATDTAAANNEFTFHLVLTTTDDDGNAIPVIEKYEYTIYDGADNPQPKQDGQPEKLGNGDSFKLKGDWYIVIKNIDTHVQYTVTEDTQTAFTLTGGSGDKGEILTGTKEAEFINTYAATGSAQVQAQKWLTGRAAMTRYQFRFELERLDENGEPTGDVMTAFSAVDGTVNFGLLNFTEADNGITYTYELREVDLEKAGYTYDPVVYMVKVTPHDDGFGTMNCDVEYFNPAISTENSIDQWTVEHKHDGEDCTHEFDVPLFQNEYHATGEYIIRGWKTLDVLPDYRALRDNEFEFVLYQYDAKTGTLVDKQHTKNHADGTFTFDRIEYHETDVGNTYFYFIRELDSGDDTVVYDQSVFCYTVTVIDNGDGTLSFEDAMYDVTGALEALLCAACEGTGWVNDPAAEPAEPDAMPEKIKCAACNGRGILLTMQALLAGDECETCTGTGRVVISDPEAPRDPMHPEAPVYKTCETCKGLGINLWANGDDETLPVFENSLNPGNLTVSKHTEEGSPDKLFHFKLKIIGEDVDDFEFNYEKGPAVNEDKSVWDTVYEEHPELAPDESTTGRVNRSAVTASVSRANPGLTTIADYPVPLAGEVTASGNLGNQIYWEIVDKELTIRRANDSTSPTISPNSNSYNQWVAAGITKVTIGYNVGMPVSNLQYLFQGITTLVEADLSGARAPDVSTSPVSLNRLFAGCTNLKKVIFGDQMLDTTNGVGMFDGCPNLESIDFGANFRYYGYMTNQPLDLSGNTKLSKIRFGDNFFSRNTLVRVTMPPIPDDPMYTGRWIRVDGEGEPYGDSLGPDDFYNATFKKGDLGGWWTWETDIAEYTIKFAYNESSPATHQETANPDEAFTFGNAPGFVNYGHKLVGWKDATTGAEYRFGDSGTYTFPPKTYGKGATVSLIAIWEKDTGSGVLEDGEFAFDLYGGEMITFTGIPAGTAYQVWEETDAGWIMVYSKDSNGVIDPLETAEASFYNLYRQNIASVIITANKTLDGAAANGYSFTLTETTNGASDMLETVTSNAGVIEFSPIFYTEPGTYTYAITENAGGDATINYDGHIILVTVVVSKDDSGNLVSKVTYEGTDGGENQAFRNSTKTGALQLTKTVVDPAWGNDANGDPYWKADLDNTTFTFTVQFFNPNGTPASGREFTWYLLGENGDRTTGPNRLTADSMGRVTVSCKAKETIEFTGLIKGMSYEIVEDAEKMPSGWSEGAHTGMKGAIPAGDTSRATAVNTYSATGDIILGTHKEFVGNELTAGLFQFELYEMPEEKLLSTKFNAATDDRTEITDDNGNPEPNPWYGTAPVTFDALKYTKPGTYTYVIREVNNGIDKVKYDEITEINVTVEVVDNGDGTLTATATYDKNGKTAETDNVYVNEMEPGNLTITKTVENATANAKNTVFTFTVEVWESDKADAKLLTGPFTVKDANGEVIGTINELPYDVRLKGGESVTIEGLPHAAHYTVTEKGDYPGFTLKNATGDVGDIEAETTVTASFVNYYSAQGMLQIPAWKYLLDPDGGTATLTDGQFTFELLDEAKNPIATATNDADGQIIFPVPQVFTEADDGKQLIFYVREKAGNDPDIGYDTHEEMVILEVWDDGQGTIRCTMDFETGEMPEFINMPTSMFTDLTITKTVTGNQGSRLDGFTFTLTLTNEKYPLRALLSFVKTGDMGVTKGSILPNANGQYSFTLKHGESILFPDLPMETKYTVTEGENNYKTTATVDGQPAQFTEDRTVEGTLLDDDTVAYTNRRDGVVPTGVSAEAVWAIPMMLLALAGMLLLKRKRGARG